MKFVAIAFTVLFLSSCTIPPPEQRAELAVKKVSSDLKLNDDQRAKLEAIKQAYLDARKATEAERSQNIEIVKGLILSDKAELPKVKSTFSARAKVGDKISDALLPKVIESHSSLTAEQKKKAAEMFEKFAKLF